MMLYMDPVVMVGFRPLEGGDQTGMSLRGSGRGRDTPPLSRGSISKPEETFFNFGMKQFM